MGRPAVLTIARNRRSSSDLVSRNVCLSRTSRRVRIPRRPCIPSSARRSRSAAVPEVEQLAPCVHSMLPPDKVPAARPRLVWLCPHHGVEKASQVLDPPPLIAKGQGFGRHGAGVRRRGPGVRVPRPGGGG